MFDPARAKRYLAAWSLEAGALVLLLTCGASAQFGGGVGTRPPSTSSGMGIEQNQMGLWMNESDDDSRRRKLENFSDSISKLDFKAPGAARKEYDKGREFLLKKDFSQAAEHFVRAIATYPSFVAAHNALGAAYLDLGQNEQAQEEFAKSVALDNHLPASFMNLGRAQWALKNFSGAQESMQKASGLAPLDLHLLSALTYAQYLNHDYGATIATAQQVHGRKHESAAIVHYFAAAAWQGQDKLPEAQKELVIFLQEAPTSPTADAARRMIEQIKDRQSQPAAAPVEIAYSASPLDPNVKVGALPAAAQRVLQRIEQQKQLAEVEAEPESVCESCAEAGPAGEMAAAIAPKPPVSAVTAGSRLNLAPYTVRSTVNEVAVFFAATDHGKAVSDLTLRDVVVRDAGRAPARVVKFRNEAQLPLRLGLVIDSSGSITKEFPFEQKAASSFLQKAMTDKKDLAFVVGFTSAVLLVQDFTADSAEISRGIDELAPAGGTALWDAVKFASEKLAGLPEEEPVAKVLVVISDGDDNASSATLKEAIASAEHNEVAVYTVSTRQFAGEDASAIIADRSMKALAARTGGAAFFPDSVGNLHHRLFDLQQVLRSRYLISYKPDQFQADGAYRTIAVVARKSGHRLRVYARRGYYAPGGEAR